MPDFWPAGQFVLRNMQVQGVNSGLAGIKILTAGSVTIENGVITEFTQQGISDVNSTTASKLFVRNMVIYNNAGAGIGGTVNIDNGAISHRALRPRPTPDTHGSAGSASSLEASHLMSVTKPLWFLAVSAAAFAPLLLFLVNGADFSGIASESVGYRFFYSMRLYAGPDSTAWLPQGHVVTTLQHIINYFVLPTLDGSLDRLRAALNTFSYWTIATINVTIVAVFLLAKAARFITWQDRALLTIVAFAPTYANQYAISYALWPD